MSVMDFDQHAPDGNPPSDPESISASVSQFQEQIEYGSRHYSVSTFRDLAEHLQTDIPFSKPPLIITFDDGYHDNYLNAYPLL